MGSYSYWISDLIEIETVDNVIEKLGVEEWALSLMKRENVWAASNRGRPQFWRATREEAEIAADGPGPTPWSVTYFKEVWLVMTGDQYIFTASTQAEAEGFIFGMLAHAILTPQLTSE